jgi:hypothetical protein
LIQQVIPELLVLLLETDSQKWERLLNTSGGKLEIDKCAFALFSWVFDDMGRATLDTQTSYKVHIRSSETNNVTLISQMSTNQSYKYVGLQLALDGNMDEKINDLRKKCVNMATVFTSTYFNHRDAK